MAGQKERGLSGLQIPKESGAGIPSPAHPLYFFIKK